MMLLDEGNIDKYLEIDIYKYSNRTYEIRQLFLIQRIIESLNLEDVTTQKRATPVIKPLLYKDSNGKPRIKNWNYRSLAGILTYLQGTTLPDILMVVHQYARFSGSPTLTYKRAIIRIGRYLIKTKDRGLICKVKKEKGLEYYVDADFAEG